MNHLYRVFRASILKNHSYSDNDANDSRHFIRINTDVLFPNRSVMDINSQKMCIANFINGISFDADSYVLLIISVWSWFHDVSLFNVKWELIDFQPDFNFL